MGSTVYLMYHELEQAGRPPCRSDNGYVRYVVAAGDFRDQMRAIARAGLRGTSVGEALDGSAGCVVITFDDGCESDDLFAAPVLREFGFTATFYVVSGFIDTPGYLSKGQLRELADAGFEIGCHSATHRFLTHLEPGELRREVVDARDQIQQTIGKAVPHFSCPGGRWNRGVQEAVRDAGYASMATSRIGTNTRPANRYQLARNPVLRSVALPTFERLCRADGLFIARLQQIALQVAKQAVGDDVYGRVRAAALRVARPTVARGPRGNWIS